MPAPVTWIIGAGLLLALVGLVFEFVLSRNLRCWWHAIEAMGTNEKWAPLFAHRNPIIVWLARIAMFMPYPAMTAFWIEAATYNPYSAALSTKVIGAVQSTHVGHTIHRRRHLNVLYARSSCLLS
jgi:hypothetical protein